MIKVGLPSSSPRPRDKEQEERAEQSNESGRKRERERGASYDTIDAMMTILFSTIQGGRVSKELILVKYL